MVILAHENMAMDTSNRLLMVGDLITSNQFYGNGKIISIVPDASGGFVLRVLHGFTTYTLRPHISNVQRVPDGCQKG